VVVGGALRWWLRKTGGSQGQGTVWAFGILFFMNMEGKKDKIAAKTELLWYQI